MDEVEARSGGVELTRHPSDDTEDVVFNPASETGFGMTEVEINGVRAHIHITHNFVHFLASHMNIHVTHRTTQVYLETSTLAYSPLFEDGTLKKVLIMFEQKYSRLYKKLEGIVHRMY